MDTAAVTTNDTTPTMMITMGLCWTEHSNRLQLEDRMIWRNSAKTKIGVGEKRESFVTVV